MIDYDKIGRRIYEERKLVRHLAQEKMAEDLGLYQADISNLENNRKGSGITDLTRLDRIASYFNIPLQQLIFGTGREDRMDRYLGRSAKIRKVAGRRRLDPAHAAGLEAVAGGPLGYDGLDAYEWGAYRIYVLRSPYTLGSCFAGEEIPPVTRLRAWVFFENAVIAAMSVAELATGMVTDPGQVKIVSNLISRDVLDAADVYRTLNPYAPLMQFTDDAAEKARFEALWAERCQALQPFAGRPVLMIENLYVRGDCRRKGMCRMLLDLLDEVCGPSTKWLNMEPSAGDELKSKFACHPVFTQAEVSQISLNAAIAERLGFTVDPAPWHRDVEVVDADGNAGVENRAVRKCAYIIHPDLLPVIANDGGLVAQGRSRQLLWQSGRKDPEQDKPAESNVLMGEDGGTVIVEVRNSYLSGKVRYVYAASGPEGTVHGVSERSPLQLGLANITPLESWDDLGRAVSESPYAVFHHIAAENLAAARHRFAGPRENEAVPCAATEADLAAPHGTLVKGMVWGYDGGGFSCGPVQGSSIVELSLLDAHNRPLYADCSVYESFVQFRFTSRPVFDDLMNYPDAEDYEKAMAAIDAATGWSVDFEAGDRDAVRELDDDPSPNAVRLLWAAMEAYFELENAGPAQAAEFIAPYLGRDLESLEFKPLRECEWLWGDWDNDEDEEDEVNAGDGDSGGGGCSAKAGEGGGAGEQAVILRGSQAASLIPR